MKLTFLVFSCGESDAGIPSTNWTVDIDIKDEVDEDYMSDGLDDIKEGLRKWFDADYVCTEKEMEDRHIDGD